MQPPHGRRCSKSFWSIAFRGSSATSSSLNSTSDISPRMAFGSDRKSTRLNSSHQIISYAVFCLKKKKKHMHAKHDLSPQPLLSIEHYKPNERTPTLPHSHTNDQTETMYHNTNTRTHQHTLSYT